MIVIARIGGVELVADDERTDQTPTPEWVGDIARRLARVVPDTYTSLPEDALVAPYDEDED